MAVVFNHLFPNRLTGGYLGVDIFFVISGFLITAHLFGELEREGRVSLARFWARRARRLLPASLTVLAVCAAATVAWLPQTRWPQVMSEVLASALYFENWQLAASAQDYFTSAQTASPVTHFWSLSVEEQFYLVWPLLVLGTWWLASRRGSTRNAPPAGPHATRDGRHRAGRPRRRVLGLRHLERGGAPGCGLLHHAGSRLGIRRWRRARRARGGARCRTPPVVRDSGVVVDGRQHLVLRGRLGRARAADAAAGCRVRPGDLGRNWLGRTSRSPAAARAGLAGRHLLLDLPVALAAHRVRPLRARTTDVTSVRPRSSCWSRSWRPSSLPCSSRTRSVVPGRSRPDLRPRRSSGAAILMAAVAGAAAYVPTTVAGDLHAVQADMEDLVIDGGPCVGAAATASSCPDSHELALAGSALLTIVNSPYTPTWGTTCQVEPEDPESSPCEFGVPKRGRRAAARPRRRLARGSLGLDARHDRSRAGLERRDAGEVVLPAHVGRRACLLGHRADDRELSCVGPRGPDGPRRRPGPRRDRDVGHRSRLCERGPRRGRRAAP